MKLISVRAFTTPLFNLTFFIVPLVVLLLLSSCNDTPKQVETVKAPVQENQIKIENANNTNNDAQFLATAAEINMEEIQLGQLAQKNSKMGDIKELGKMMETDHSKALKELRDLASKKQMTIPGTLNDMGKSDYDNLVKKTGKDFDKTYCSMMVTGHKDAISKFENEVSNGTDAEVKSWATKMLPALKAHLNHSTTCQKECQKM